MKKRWIVAALIAFKASVVITLIAAGSWSGVTDAVAGTQNVREVSSIIEALAPELNAPTERALIDAIERRTRELDEREEALRAREARLVELKTEISEKVTEFASLRNEMEKFRNEIDGLKNDRIKRLVKIYEAMEPEEAAVRFEKLEDEVAVLILSTMKPANAGRILGLVDVKKSVKLSHMLRLKSKNY